MPLVKKIKYRGYQYPYLSVVDSYRTPELKEKYFNYIESLFGPGNDGAYHKYYESDYGNEYYRRFALFLTINDLIFNKDSSRSISYLTNNEFTFNKFMEDDNYFNNFLELFIGDEYFTELSEHFTSILINHNKRLIKSRMADCSYLYELFALVNLYYSENHQELENIIFTDFTFMELTFITSKNLSVKIKVDYYKSYLNSVREYVEKNNILAEDHIWNIFNFVFVEKYNNSSALEDKIDANTNYSSIVAASIKFPWYNYNTNFMMYIFYTFLEEPGRFNFNRLLAILEPYEFENIEAFKNFIKNLDDSMPMEWTIELTDGIENLYAKDLTNIHNKIMD